MRGVYRERLVVGNDYPPVCGCLGGRMSLAVKMEVASNPVGVSLLGPDAVLEPDRVADPSEDRWRGR